MYILRVRRIVFLNCTHPIIAFPWMCENTSATRREIRIWRRGCLCSAAAAARFKKRARHFSGADNETVLDARASVERCAWGNCDEIVPSGVSSAWIFQRPFLPLLDARSARETCWKCGFELVEIAVNVKSRSICVFNMSVHQPIVKEFHALCQRNDHHRKEANDTPLDIFTLHSMARFCVYINLILISEGMTISN